ncbi:hypothetical protein RchiOBHm_Chr1g0317341 [Rosa chinensis]|uniref:Uncharacterized protein n=1 Tax=Rosa chinensis TaxID=74649 RepID=A0A2P6S7V7_ROSCH|nr:hypothetical protein RchiOBHm_Chr1g0317341 [Rosa chinensis]
MKVGYVNLGQVSIVRYRPYFPAFRQPGLALAADTTLGQQLAPLGLLSHLAEECFEVLFKCPEFSTEQYAMFPKPRTTKKNRGRIEKFRA